MTTFPSRILLSSSEVSDISGHSPEDLEKIGGFEQYIVKNDLSKRELAIRHAIWTKKTYSLEYGFFHADGTVHTFFERGNVCTNACDMWLDVMLIDITEQEKSYHEVVKERDLLKQALDSIDDYVSIVSPDSQILFVNKSLTGRINQSPDHYIAKFSSSPGYNNKTQKSGQMEEVYDDFAKKVYSISRSSIQSDKGHVGYILISRDVSIEKYREESLLQTIEKVTQKLHELGRVLKNLEESNSLLEQETLKQVEDVTRLSKIIEDKNLLVEQLVNQKELFITQLAHDLRTPLTPIIAMLPLIIDSIQDPDSKELLQLFYNCIENLQNMVNTIIQYATLNQVNSIEDYSLFNVDYLIDDALKINSFLIKEKELNIDISLPPEVSVSLSKNLAPMIFRNLVSNAVSYNIFRGSIVIQGEIHKGVIRILISDSGIGIPHHLLETMWDEFVIGDTARKNPHSKGLGLSIVRQIVVMHGGTITATSNGIGTGATFTIALPLNRSETLVLCPLSTLQ
ncbi:PAS domain-containing sensor histidine kinase [uncultured Methanospirillum sp.]|uniref:sensor histidine kinase n=1 Tax=uncultured Methanospirillum sp. TaxID=262503 RepID=UPI0029C60472|nr:PAS domain-containing sensor histidine kinase [uncultured Methanospirillum sp.]